MTKNMNMRVKKKQYSAINIYAIWYLVTEFQIS